MRNLIKVLLLLFTCNTANQGYATNFYIRNGDVAMLINAIEQSNVNQQTDTIYLPLKGFFKLTVPILSATVPSELDSGLPDIIQDNNNPQNKLVIYGNGAIIERDVTAPDFRIALISGANVEINDLYVRNGTTANLHNGAGICNYNGIFTCNNCTFANNTKAFLGGAVYANISAFIYFTNCTLTTNNASAGSAIYTYSGNGTLLNCTIAGNTSTTSTGTALQNPLTVDDVNHQTYLKNSIIATNKNVNGINADMSGVFKTLGHNLLGDNSDPVSSVYFPSGTPNPLDYVGTPTSPIDPMLNALNFNGGLTPTLAIKSTNSYAFNNGGLKSDAPTQDQAGNARIGNPEIGSLEIDNNSILRPGILIKQGTDNIVSGTGSYSFDSVPVLHSSPAIPFTIENTGFSLALNLLCHPKIIISGHDSLDFLVNQSQTATSIPGNGSTTFDLFFAPLSVGKKTALVNIVSNDTAKTIYTFIVNGAGKDIQTFADHNSIENSITVSPNPNAGIFTISMDNTPLELCIVDVSGKLIYNPDKNFKNNKFPLIIDLSKYAKGIYFMKIKTDQTIVLKKIVID